MFRRLQRTLAALALTGLFAGSALAGGEGWTHDYEQAKATAANDGKDLLLDFTGSDWCGWCIKLNDEVFSKDAFKDYAKANLVLVELDFPRDKSKLTEETMAQNARLKNEFSIRGYPTIILTDAQGRPYAQTGYQRGGPEAYVEHLEQLKQTRVTRDEHFAAAEKATGAEKAKHLHEGLKAVGDELALNHYQPTINQIIELDADNTAGLKSHYETLAKAREYEKTLQGIMMASRQDPKGALEQVDKLLKEEGLPAKTKQMGLVVKSQIQMFSLKDKDSAKKTLLQAIEADPDSDIADQLREAVKRVFPEDDAADAS